MINIHLTQDEKFINSSVSTFEKYYPGKNLFIVNSEIERKTFVTPRSNVFFRAFNHVNLLEELQSYIPNIYNQRVNILVHFLTRDATFQALKLKKVLKNSYLYWIFYGADLYSYLERTGKYQLFDYKVYNLRNRLRSIIGNILGRSNYIKEFCAVLDYFCFWNYYDYKLLCNFINTKAQFKFFFYITTETKEILRTNFSIDQFVLVNHSASLTGNHLTIMEKLYNFSLSNVKLVLPLSYGSEKHKKLIISKANCMFPDKCVFITNFMSLDTYYELISKCQCAIMGHRRQEAGGNINFLLRNGTKVFLREDNSLLRFYRDLGCFVYSFEKDLNAPEDLSPLTEAQREINKKIIMSCFSQQQTDAMMLNLFN